MKGKSSNISQMIWVCFVGGKLRPIILFSDTIKQDIYMQILQMEFELFLEALAADRITNLEFQQDNAYSHVTKRTCKFLEALANKHKLTIINWLANSSDLSPIENL